MTKDCQEAILYLPFLDESGTPDDDLFAFGGAVVKAADWHLLRRRWDDCLADAGWPLDKELKWSGTGSGYEEFFGSDENTYSTALMFIAERFQRFLSHHDE